MLRYRARPRSAPCRLDSGSVASGRVRPNAPASDRRPAGRATPNLGIGREWAPATGPRPGSRSQVKPNRGDRPRTQPWSTVDPGALEAAGGSESCGASAFPAKQKRGYSRSPAASARVLADEIEVQLVDPLVASGVT